MKDERQQRIEQDLHDEEERIRKARRDYDRRRLYGISTRDVDRLVEEQGGLCAVCGEPLNLSLKVKHGLIPVVDHERAVRGILHWNCNVGIGKLKHSPDVFVRAIIYCIRHRAIYGARIREERERCLLDARNAYQRAIEDLRASYVELEKEMASLGAKVEA
jgi:hypothetical protein